MRGRIIKDRVRKRSIAADIIALDFVECIIARSARIAGVVYKVQVRSIAYFGIGAAIEGPMNLVLACAGNTRPSQKGMTTVVLPVRFGAVLGGGGGSGIPSSAQRSTSKSSS